MVENIGERVVLIVEDELPLLQIIAHAFQKNGWSPVTARTVAEAWGYLEQIERVDVIWLDHFLPEGEGIELLKQVRATPKWKDTHVILVSNAIEPEIVNEYIKHGVTRYYTKVLKPLDKIVSEISLLSQVPGSGVDTPGSPVQ
ncbi:MAG: response regulator [Patescibacteria group bacterium]